MQGAGMDAFSAGQAVTLWEQATSVVYTLAVTLITWWFGDRRVAKNLMYQAQQGQGASK
jgi:hypothetical protein